MIKKGIANTPEILVGLRNINRGGNNLNNQETKLISKKIKKKNIDIMRKAILE